MIDKIKEHAKNLNEILEMEGEEGQFEYLIEVGKKSSNFTNREKNSKNKMSGCLAQVWIKHKLDSGRFFFSGDSDAMIVKGLVVIIAEAMSGLKLNEILKKHKQ